MEHTLSPSHSTSCFCTLTGRKSRTDAYMENICIVVSKDICSILFQNKATGEKKQQTNSFLAYCNLFGIKGCVVV
jgi:hypothetical protein